ERSGARVGLFQLSNQNLYSSIPTDRLMQSFPIVQETKDEVVIDIQEGFKSLVVNETTALVDKAYMDHLKKINEDAIENTINVKEVLVRKVESSNNTMYIEQAVRIVKSNENKEKITEDEGLMETDSPLANENVTARVIIELKPYMLNKNFQTKLFDKEQKVGYFVNFVNAENSELLFPQITKWDTSPEREPITVALESNIPANIIQSIKEGVEYWNKALGQNVLVVKTGYKITDKITDRMIIIRWVNWDDAGFAYASMQTDPVTGEILRAQIFMTSSWIKMTDKGFALPIFAKNKTVKKSKIKTNSPWLCEMNLDISDIKNSLINITDEKLKDKSIQDTIRNVIAHEMGHVMGLRHNFAGSFNHEGSDQDVIRARKDYFTQSNYQGFTTTTSIMDYEKSRETFITGAYIKHSILSYDQAAIDWGYKDRVVNLPNQSYCSDEHIDYADKKNVKLYGCERMDALKNSYLALGESLKQKINSSVRTSFENLIAKQNSENPYILKSELKDISNLVLILEEDGIKNLFFQGGQKSITANIDQVLKGKLGEVNGVNNVIFEEISTSTMLKEHIKEAGGLTGVITKALEGVNLDQPINLMQNQVKEFFSKLDVKAIGINEVDLKYIYEQYLKQAIDLDNQLLSSVLVKFVPSQKSAYSFKSTEEIQDSILDPTKYPESVLTYRSEVIAGDADLLMKLFRKAILTSNQALEVKKVTANGIPMDIVLLGYNYDRENLFKAFSIDNWPSNMKEQMSVPLKKELDQLKMDLAKNTLSVLNAFGVPVPIPLTYAALVAELDKIPVNKLEGIYVWELKNKELMLLKSVEEIK
ncbi:MAG: zinc-dependent metalloprotease, partial [Pseudobdellovibrio sp.]